MVVIFFSTMNPELQNIIQNSSFTVEPGIFVYTKARSVPVSAKHFLITQDRDEITVVTERQNLSEIDMIERNKDDYVLIALNVSIPFYSVGFLAAVSNKIAEVGMNILIVSTYSKDYIMVKYDLLEKAKGVLLNMGFNET